MADYRYIQDRRTGTKHRILGVVDDTLTEEGIAADAKVVGDALATKAEVDGSYDSMTVGNAEQLISSVYEEDSVPYQFRTSGGSIDIGDREEDTIIGGTVAWNQGVRELASTYWSFVTATGSITNGEASFTVQSRYGYMTNKNSYYIPLINGHKYLFSAFVNTSASSGVRIGLGASATFSNTGLVKDVPGNGSYVYSYRINAWGGDNGAYPFIVMDMRSADWDVIKVKNPQVFDLTQMFGSAIADYIYALETNTAGAGVAFFRKLFPKPYYAYNPGELLSVSDLQSHDMVGFNQWDEQWESGTIDTRGAKVPDSNYIRSKNYIPVVPGASYCLSTPGATHQIFYYDSAKNFISFSYSSSNGGKVYTVPDNCCFVLFRPETTYGATYKNDICINLHWDGERDGEYEPYKKWSYPLDDSLTLRGIPKLDADNKLYYDGDVYESDGTVTRKYGIVDLGTLTYTYDSSASRFYVLNFATTYGAKTVGNANSDINNAICTKYGALFTDAIWNASYDKIFNIASTGTLSIKDTAYSDASTFKTAMSGVYLVYELAEYTTESADPYQNPQIVDDFGTEEYVTTSIVPVGHETKYQPNLRAKLEMAPDSPDSNGTYVVKHENGENTYIPLTIPNPFPTYPYTPGNYRLQLQVTENSITLHWVEDN